MFLVQHNSHCTNYKGYKLVVCVYDFHIIDYICGGVVFSVLWSFDTRDDLEFYYCCSCFSFYEVACFSIYEHVCVCMCFHLFLFQLGLRLPLVHTRWKERKCLFVSSCCVFVCCVQVFVQVRLFLLVIKSSDVVYDDENDNSSIFFTVNNGEWKC